MNNTYEIDNFDTMQKSPIVFFRYTIQMIVFLIVIYLVHLNFSIMNALWAFVILIVSEAVLEVIENSKYSKTKGKNTIFKKCIHYLDTKFYYFILIISFIVRLILYFKLDFEYSKFENGLVIINCLCGSTVVLFIYLISKELFSRRTGQIISIFYSIGIGVSSYCTIITNYHIFTIIILSSIYLLISKRYNNINYILKNSIVGLLLAISAIIRIEGAVYVLAFVMYLFANSLIKNNEKKDKYIAIVLIVAMYIFVNLLTAGIVKATKLNDRKFFDLNAYKEIFEGEKKNIEQFELNQKEYWNNTDYEYLNNKLNISKVNKFDSTILLFCYINAAILVIYCKVKNIEDERMYLLYIIVLVNFFIFGFIKVNNEYSYISKIVIYILAAGGLTIFKKNAELEAREKFGIKLLTN